MTALHTPETLAREWRCSARHIRRLVSSGELRAVRLGAKLIRIPAEEAQRFLARMATASDACGGDSSSYGMTSAGGAAVTRLTARTRAALRSRRPESTRR